MALVPVENPENAEAVLDEILKPGASLAHVTRVARTPAIAATRSPESTGRA